VRRLGGKIPLASPKHIGEDNIKGDLKNKCHVGPSSGSINLRIDTSGRLF
jgi:hypothetical protein